MKSVIAYAFLVTGIPVLLGMLFAALIKTPVLILLGRLKLFRVTMLLYLEIFDGIGTIFAAILIFHFLGLTLNPTIPIIIVVWESIYFIWYKQSHVAWFCVLTGIIIGWLIIPRFISA
jgi:hypothetical protein